MSPPSGSWSTQQLAEFLAVVSSFADEALATSEAVERAAEALEAEVGAVVRDGHVVTAIGFPYRQVPERVLVEVAAGERAVVEVPGVGPCRALAARLDDLTAGAPPAGHLILARSGDDGFSGDEADLLRGMARVLSLTLRMVRLLEAERARRAERDRQAAENARLLASLQERQVLLERLSRIQRSISTRAPLNEVLDAIVAGASELLGVESAGLRLVQGDGGSATMVSSVGLEQQSDAIRSVPVSSGATGRAMAERTVIRLSAQDCTPEDAHDLAIRDLTAAMVAPVFEHGHVIGALSVGSRRAGRSFNATEEEMLRVFAEHASLALNDARSLREALYQASHDTLTGLPNRTLLQQQLADALARAGRRSRVGVLLLDLDHFKLVNDSLGHAAGDELLVAVADRLRGCVCAGDMAARFGGDEFAVLLTGLEEPAEAVSLAGRILEALRPPFPLRGKQVSVAASVGIATLDERAAGPEQAGELLRDADVAMYRAKGSQTGYEVFSPDMRAAVVERLELEADLRKAVEEGQFVLHYQPTVDLRDGRIVGVEALVRWQHPRRGLMPPAEFIPLAEETGLIIPIGRWVLYEACRQAHAWRSDPGLDPGLMVNVNLSGRQLEQPDLLAEVTRALQVSELDAAGLVLEITESVLMHDTALIIPKLLGIKALGVQFAIDDFGTGYSSLGYLQRFPVDVLKIDKSFVDELGADVEDSALAAAIVKLGQTLGLQTIAEGIESAAQAHGLRALGCHYGQGFHFARPLPAAEVAVLLAELGRRRGAVPAPVATP